MLNGIKKLHLEHLILLVLQYPLGILICIIQVAVVQCVYRICCIVERLGLYNAPFHPSQSSRNSHYVYFKLG